MTGYSFAVGLGKGCRTIHPDPPSSGNRPRPGTSKVVVGRLRQLWPWFTADGMCHAIEGPRSATAWFEWVLSPDGWSNVEGLLEPFTELTPLVSVAHQSRQGRCPHLGTVNGKPRELFRFGFSGRKCSLLLSNDSMLLGGDH